MQDSVGIGMIDPQPYVTAPAKLVRVEEDL